MIIENNEYFSIRNCSIENGLASYIIGEIYLLFTDSKRVNIESLSERIGLLQILDWNVYEKMRRLFKN